MRTPKDLSHRQIHKRYLDYLDEQNYSTRTIEEYGNRISDYLDFLQDNRQSFDAPDQVVIDKFRRTFNSHTMQKQVKAAIINFYDFRAVKYNDPKPDLVIKIPKSKNLDKRFTPTIEQIDKMRKAAGDLEQEFFAKRAKVIIEIAIATACREVELTRMKLDHISDDLWQIKLMGKGGKVREVSLTSSARKALKQYLKVHDSKNNEYLFYTKVSPTISHTTISFLISEVQKRAGLSKLKHNITIHAIRRGVATEMARNKVSLVAISHFLGHSNTQVTARYVNLDDAWTDEQVMDGHPFK